MKGGAIYFRNQTCPECHGRNFIADCDNDYTFDCSQRHCDGWIQVNPNSQEGRRWKRECCEDECRSCPRGSFPSWCDGDCVYTMGGPGQRVNCPNY